MKAIGRNLIIQAIKQGVSETKGGLLLAEKQREDIRYAEGTCLLYTSPSPRDVEESRMPSSA